MVTACGGQVFDNAINEKFVCSLENRNYLTIQSFNIGLLTNKWDITFLEAFVWEQESPRSSSVDTANVRGGLHI